MNKEIFLNTIAFIQELNQEQHQFNDLMRTIDDNFGGGYIHHKAINYLSTLLAELSNDECEEIDYWMWELDFGEKYYDGCITREDGSIIKLKTAEDLYNLILEDNNQVNF